MILLIVIRSLANMISARCSTDGWWCHSLTDCSGVYQFRQPCSEIVRMWMCDVVATTQTSSHRSTSFCYWRLCGVRCEPWVGMCYSCVWVYVLPWRHGYFVNSWGSLLDLGCSSLRCVVIGVTLGMFASFWHCWPCQRCVSLDSWHRILWAIYIHRSVPVMLGRTIGSETRQRWSYVFFTMSSLRWIDYMTSRSFGLPEVKSSYCWSIWKFLLYTCYMQRSYWIWGVNGFLVIILRVKMSCGILSYLSVWRCICGIWNGHHQSHETLLRLSWNHGQHRFNKLHTV